MRIDGHWYFCDDFVVRPVIQGKAQAADGTWVFVSFLVDSGADRTVSSADIIVKLGLKLRMAVEQLAGVGGQTKTVEIDTKIQLALETAEMATFSGWFAAFTDAAALDMSVLGRDITNLFALIVDRQQDVVCLVGKGHRYNITAG